VEGCYKGSLMSKTKTEKGSLRVWYINSIGDKRTDVKTVEEAKTIIRQWAKEDLEDDSIAWSTMGLEIYETDGIECLIWQEWYDLEGYDICDVIDTEKN